MERNGTLELLRLVQRHASDEASHQVWSSPAVGPQHRVPDRTDTAAFSQSQGKTEKDMGLLRDTSIGFRPAVK